MVAENSANITLINNKRKAWFLVCFQHVWERKDLMKRKLGLASVATFNPFIIVMICAAP